MAAAADLPADCSAYASVPLPVTMGELIQFAFGVRDFQVSGGPDWLHTDRFDILATTRPPVDLDDKLVEPYLQSFLAERAGFRYHTEMRKMQTYSLAVAKDGPKLTGAAHPGEDSTHEISHGPARTTAIATGATMADLARILNRELGRTVIDTTSLKGQFDLRLEWFAGLFARLECAGPRYGAAAATWLEVGVDERTGGNCCDR